MVSAPLNYYHVAKNNQPIINENKSSIRNKLIREVALNTLKEALISLTITGAVCCLFVAAPAIPSLLIVTISVIAVNLLMRSFTAYLLYDLHLLKQRKHNPDDVKVLENIIRVLQFLCPCVFTIQHDATTNALIHEAGHAFAALAVYQNPQPRIEIFPAGGGVTYHVYSPLTRLGEYLGFQGSETFISAAGAGLGIISAAIMIGMSHAIKKDHPQLSLYLLCSAICTIAHHVIYALSALWETSPSSGHDFVAVWKYGGIHPVVSVICMVALPILVKLTLYAISSYRSTARFNV